MKTNNRFLSLAASVACLVFTFSCSSGSDDSPSVNSNNEDSSSSADNGNYSSSGTKTDNNSSSSSNGENGGYSSSSTKTSDNSSSSSNSEINGSSSSSSSSIIQSSSSVPLKECTDIFNPANKFCYDGVVYDRCNGKEYNPTNQKCESNIVKNQCGTDWYNPTSMQFCSGNKVFYKCDGMEYSPTTHICSGGVATPATCNGIAYNPLEQRCCVGVLDEYIGNEFYTTGITDQCLLEYGGQSYRTVTIGTQIWMAENLNYSNNGTIGRCYGAYNSSANNDNCIKYGRLYDKATALIVCPLGWHLPTSDEWNTLSNYVESRNGCSNCNAKHLKATSDWRIGENGTDTYGFAALPGGEGDTYTYSGEAGISGYWWSASESWNIRMIDTDRWTTDRTGGGRLFSVRCVHD
jgi:uncharacterized protein (TIGR02145 family)